MASKKIMDRLEAAKTRSKNLAKSIGKGGKGTFITAATGGGLYYLVGAAQERIEFLSSHPYATPAAMIVAGHFAKRKHHDMGTATIAIGGFLGAQAYDTASEEETTKTPAEGINPGEAGAWGDPGWMTGGEAGAMQTNIGRTDNALTMGSMSTSGQPGAAALQPAAARTAGDFAQEAYGLMD